MIRTRTVYTVRTRDGRDLEVEVVQKDDQRDGPWSELVFRISGGEAFRLLPRELVELANVAGCD